MEDIYYILFRHKSKIVLGAIIGMLGAVGVYVWSPVDYRSEAKLLVRFIEQDTGMDAQKGRGNILRPDRRGDKIMHTEIQVLKTRDLVETVVEEIGPEKIIEAEESRKTFMDTVEFFATKLGLSSDEQEELTDYQMRREAVKLIKQNMTVRAPNRGNVINVAYYGPTKDLAKKVLDRVVDQYLQNHADVHKTHSSLSNLVEKAEMSHEILLKTEADLLALRRELGATSFESAQELIFTELPSLRDQLRDTEADLAEWEARERVLRQVAPSLSQSSETVDGAATNLPPSELLDQLAILKEREMRLLATFKETSIPIVQIRKEIEAIEKQLVLENPASFSVMRGTGDGRATDNMRLARLNAEADIAAFKSRIETLKKQLNVTSKEAEKVDAMGIRMAELRRKKALQEEKYLSYAQKLEEARIDSELDDGIQNISKLQNPTDPSRFRGRMRDHIIMALAFGLGGGLAWAFLAERLIDRSIKRPSEVPLHSNSQVLLTVPRIESAGSMRRRLPRPMGPKLLPAKAGGDSKSQSGGNHQSFESNFQSSFRPYFETLRDRVLLLLDPDIRTHLIGITGCGKGAGASTTAAGLAITLARNGDGRVLLVEAGDLTHEVAEMEFGKAISGKLLEILSDNNSNITIVQPNLFVISATEIGVDGETTASTGSFDDILNSVRDSNYDFVIFDLPPTHETSYALRIAPQLEGVILIAEAEKTDRNTLSHASALLERSKIKVIGSILNKRRTYVPQWLQEEV